MTATTLHPQRRRPLWVKILAALVVLLGLLALVIAFFPWDVLRGPLNRYVSDKTGRHFEITRRLDVDLGRTTRIIADGIEFANPEWARNPHLVKAQGAEIHVELLPLLKRQIVMPRIELKEPQLGLQVEPDGRRSWALGRDTGDPKNIPDIGALVVDKGTVHYVASGHGADIQADFAIDGPLALPSRDRSQPAQPAAVPASASASGAHAPRPEPSLPLSFEARGTWQKEKFTAKGRTGNVLYLSAPLKNPFPLQVDLVAGSSSLRADGQLASLATLDGADARVELRGANLADLYKFIGVVLPSTPRYAVRGHLAKQGEVWRMREIDARLGRTDLAGELTFDRRQPVPLLVGRLKSNLLDFNDLAPIVGLPEQPTSATMAPIRKVAATREDMAGDDRPKQAKAGKPPRDPNRKVLPNAQLDLKRLKAMNSDVHFAAAKVVNAGNFPLERMTLGVKLQGGVLNLDPVNLGIAGGTVTGRMKIDSHTNPALAAVDLKARSLELSKMFRDVNLTRTSFGRIHGDIDLQGRGNSVAQMLAGSSGNFALMMGKGQISNLLLEIAGLDGAEIIKFLLRGDRNVGVRCAATAFDVKDGLMTSRALMLDTVDTIVYGEGSVNFRNEKLDMFFRPYPKDMSILSLRSPLKVTGSLGAPQAGPDKGALAARAGAALALGAINPLLAIAATVETGPGTDADCGAILREAASPDAVARVEVLTRAQQQAMGGPPGKRGGLLGFLRGDKAAAPAQGEAAPAGTAQRAPATSASGAGAAAAAGTGPHAPGAPGVPYGR